MTQLGIQPIINLSQNSVGVSAAASGLFLLTGKLLLPLYYAGYRRLRWDSLGVGFLRRSIKCRRPIAGSTSMKYDLIRRINENFTFRRTDWEWLLDLRADNTPFSHGDKLTNCRPSFTVFRRGAGKSTRRVLYSSAKEMITLLRVMISGVQGQQSPFLSNFSIPRSGSSPTNPSSRKCSCRGRRGLTN